MHWSFFKKVATSSLTAASAFGGAALSLKYLQTAGKEITSPINKPLQEMSNLLFIVVVGGSASLGVTVFSFLLHHYFSGHEEPTPSNEDAGPRPEM